MTWFGDYFRLRAKVLLVMLHIYLVLAGLEVCNHSSAYSVIVQINHHYSLITCYESSNPNHYALDSATNLQIYNHYSFHSATNLQAQPLLSTQSLAVTRPFLIHSNPPSTGTPTFANPPILHPSILFTDRTMAYSTTRGSSSPGSNSTTATTTATTTTSPNTGTSTSTSTNTSGTGGTRPSPSSPPTPAPRSAVKGTRRRLQGHQRASHDTEEAPSQSQVQAPSQAQTHPPQTCDSPRDSTFHAEGDLPLSFLMPFSHDLLKAVNCPPFVLEKTVPGVGNLHIEIWNSSTTALTARHYRATCRLEGGGCQGQGQGQDYDQGHDQGQGQGTGQGQRGGTAPRLNRLVEAPFTFMDVVALRMQVDKAFDTVHDDAHDLACDVFFHAGWWVPADDEGGRTR